jgi:hypothetical protein
MELSFMKDRARSNEKKTAIMTMREKIQGWDEIKREAELRVVAATG